MCVPLEDQLILCMWSRYVCATDQSMDQSYGDMMHGTKNLMHVQRTIPMGQCMYCS